MKVRIYKQENKRVTLLFEPGRGRHKVPVLVSDVGRGELKNVAATEIAKMRAEKPPK